MTEPNDEAAHRIEDLDEIAAELARVLSRAFRGTARDRAESLDRLSQGFPSPYDHNAHDVAGACYVTAVLCHDLPARDREELIAALRERCLP